MIENLAVANSRYLKLCGSNGNLPSLRSKSFRKPYYQKRCHHIFVFEKFLFNVAMPQYLVYARILIINLYASPILFGKHSAKYGENISVSRGVLAVRR